MTNNVVVILTALNVEYEAVQSRLTAPKPHPHERGTLYEAGAVPGTSAEVVVGLTGKGNQSAAALVERSIDAFSPIAVLYVGVAGALWDTAGLGDVVVATHVYGYHGGTSDNDGLKARPRGWEADHGILQLAAQVDRRDEWAAGLAGRPKVHYGPVAAGEIVHNSRTARAAAWLREHFNDAVAVEMEGAGVAQAAHLGHVPVAIIRGISDRADGRKATADDRVWQPRAAANAAAFAVRLAAELIKGHEDMTKSAEDRTQTSGAVTNTAYGQVGIQAGTVTGSTVWMTSAPGPAAVTDLAAALASVRDDLAREGAAGKIDDATYDAACAELDIADRALKTNTSDSRRTFVLAMRRLWGLVVAIADLATKITAVIAAVKSLS